MDAQPKKLLPQEGTINSVSGESLTDVKLVCPSYSGGGKLCSGYSLDVSGLPKATSDNVASDTSKVSQWTKWNVVPHKRPCKKKGKTTVQPKVQLPKRHLERSRLNRRARKGAEVTIAAARTQRVTVSPNFAEMATTHMALSRPPNPKRPRGGHPERSRFWRARREAAPTTAAAAETLRECVLPDYEVGNITESKATIPTPTPATIATFPTPIIISTTSIPATISTTLNSTTTPTPITIPTTSRSPPSVLPSTPPPPSPPRQLKWKPTPRGRRGRRIAAKTPNALEKEQPEPGNRQDERASLKRVHLDDNQSVRGEVKRAKTDSKPKRTVCYADESQSDLKVAVVTVPPRDLSQEQAEQLLESIDDSIMQAVMSPVSPNEQVPSFRGRPFLMEGMLAMWCENENALSWLEKTISTIPSPIPDTTLTVMKQSERKKKIRAGLLLHTRITDSTTLQKMLSVQNPWYKVDTWQCYSMSVDEDASKPGSKEKVVHLILGIPEDQLLTITKRDRRVSHMSGSGYIRFFTTEAALTAEKTPVETSVDPDASTSAPHQTGSEGETDPSGPPKF